MLCGVKPNACINAAITLGAVQYRHRHPPRRDAVSVADDFFYQVLPDAAATVSRTRKESSGALRSAQRHSYGAQQTLR